MIQPGRWTARLDGPFVVFLIGMRIGAPWRIRHWLPVARAMGPMLRELQRDPAAGLLTAETGWLRGGPLVVQYWRDTESLLAYAKSADRHHRPAWAAFNRAAQAGATTGIWHETYAVHPGGWEAIYVNMPLLGLGKAGTPVAATGAQDTAQGRLQA